MSNFPYAQGFDSGITMSKRKLSVVFGAIVLAGALVVFSFWSNIVRWASLSTIEVVGNIAVRNMPDDLAGGFHRIPVEVRKLDEGIYQATGIANTNLILTAEGKVLFDAGIAIQAARQIELLNKISDAPLTHIILSHSHSDHVGGTRFWREQGTQVIAHREFVEEQRYLTELQPYFWHRNRTLFPWMPETPPDNPLWGYGGIKPDITVGEDGYRFTRGGVEFVVLSTPGAEGADNISLWLPQRKILFTGDFFGPLFPQFPNIFTMRGEKVRKPVEYINSLDRIIALEPEMIVPGHHSPVTGKENLRVAMTKIRDAVRFVHDETVQGMNAGKTVHQLMREIRLPAELALTEEHGKVSWGVRSIWEYYATWFHFDSTASLYPVPVTDIYPDLAGLAGEEALLRSAEKHLEKNEPVKALHYLEILLAANPGHGGALQLRLAVLETLLRSSGTGGNNYEKDYLRSRIAITKDSLATVLP